MTEGRTKLAESRIGQNSIEPEHVDTGGRVGNRDETNTAQHELSSGGSIIVIYWMIATFQYVLINIFSHWKQVTIELRSKHLSCHVKVVTNSINNGSVIVKHTSQP